MMLSFKLLVLRQYRRFGIPIIVPDKHLLKRIVGAVIQKGQNPLFTDMDRWSPYWLRDFTHF